MLKDRSCWTHQSFILSIDQSAAISFFIQHFRPEGRRSCEVTKRRKPSVAPSVGTVKSNRRVLLPRLLEMLLLR
ncbi:hypothetical protein AGIG_G12834 [Arapaima gigas]